MKKKFILTFLVSFCLAAGAAAWVFAPGEDPGRSVGGNTPGEDLGRSVGGNAPGEDPGRSVGGNAPGEDPGQSGGGSAASDVLHRANGFSSEAWSGATASGAAVTCRAEVDLEAVVDTDLAPARSRIDFMALGVRGAAVVAQPFRLVLVAINFLFRLFVLRFWDCAVFIIGFQ